ncbi:Piwi-domain-containing protein [Dichomitus squalens LYAD-421 SS1]|uniref:Piwi-domain-containing protein n=1 Tax=Dichomitus squalens (strain LYAD-421) TaxID=732165 RepID=R7T1A9_DICSQ|nr:Piwi-domain-containing protein [Dichomitus squalens LYAD-421 SS1]EJF62043.1 Piwi-domain-containing protein [Dichomitus squalens LYAD-421 SS1]
MSQPRGGPRGRPGAQGQSPGRGGRGSSPSPRGRASPVPARAVYGVSRGRGARGDSVSTRGSSRGGSRGGAPAEVFAASQPPNQDARLADAELDRLVQSFKSVRIPPDMPLRPGWGTQGDPGVVRTNFFAIRLPQNATYYEYEISIQPKAQAKGDRRFRIMQLVEQSPQFRPYVAQVAHDRSQRLVSIQQLPQPLEIPIRYLEEDQADDPNALNFTVEMKLLSKLDMSQLNQYMSGKPEHRNIDTQPLLSALNLVVQQYAQRHGVRVGKNKYFFPTSSEHHTLSLGVEAFRGFFMSVRPMYKQLMVNINLCMTAFYNPGKLADAMDAFQRQSRGGMPNSFAEKLKVSTKHLGYTRKFTIYRIMNGKTARKETFDCQEFGGRITVENFFKRKYNITLRRHSDLPLINVSTNRKKPIYLPAELCDIVPGQAYRGKLDRDQTAAMIKVACNPPAFNGNTIVDQGFADLGLRPNASGATLGTFGISISPDMQVVPYRRLPPPAISYRVGRPRVQDAGWNILDVKFQVGGNMTNWAVLLVQDGRRDEFQGPNDPALIAFLKAFLAKCNNSGILGADKPPRIMSVDLPRLDQDTPTRAQAIAAISKVFRDNLNPKKKPSFVLVLLSGIDKYIYPGIKQLADVELGIHTIHMLLTKARDDRGNRQDQYFSNVALKVNTKLGGVNHQLDDRSMQWLRGVGGNGPATMIMGIDVTHPSPLSLPGTPSVAAVVASVDSHFAQYPASLMLQKPDWNKESKEMVEGLTQMTIERLQLYQKKNGGKLPERIFVFRDGVSEGQYPQLLSIELPRLQAAFKQISPLKPYKPKLSIIVCGKRHHARFWPVDSQHATRNGNTFSGTVVDKGITDAYDFDYYLQAHSGLQGHVKATHYVVVYDENKLDADTIQQGTHTASYMYARATKAVSLIPAAYYADIACERGREYLNVLMNASDDSRSSAAETADREAQKEATFQSAVRMWGNGVNKELKDTMFYI